MDGAHLSVRAVAALVTLEAGSGVETRLEFSHGARVLYTTSLGNKTRDGGSVVSLEKSRGRLDEFNSSDERLNRVRSTVTDVTLGEITISNLTIISSIDGRPAVLTGGARSASGLADSKGTVDTLLGEDRSSGTVVVSISARAGSG